MLNFKGEFRCPVHGFIRVTELELAIINHPAFQRLRRIRQLAWTDYIYPGAMHTRFEHSLGVMHIADMLFTTLVDRDAEILRSEYNFAEGQLDRTRQIIRLAALVHDLGHGPFSHAAEDNFPFKTEGKRWVHEDYSAAVVDFILKDMIENHREAASWGITTNNIKEIFLTTPRNKIDLIWKNIISGQLDADRMDYLLRDAYHCGVQYGNYDLRRLSREVCLIEDQDLGGHRIGITDDGLHAAEGLIIARYMMFTQVYFHKTRVIFDYHLSEAIKNLFKTSEGQFPAPVESGIGEFIRWDDWRVLGKFSDGEGGEHAKNLLMRDHFRSVYKTSEIPTIDELEIFNEVFTKISPIGAVKRDASKSWYKLQDDQIQVRDMSSSSSNSMPLSEISPVVKGLTPVNQKRIYVPLMKRAEACSVIEGMGR